LLLYSVFSIVYFSWWLFRIN